ncbi:MAG: sulfatase-like hydrolase/transferase [Bacteroidales bacterium]|nr:sulfatase-like hydrolase/transferase [Bacteroidales bacterium]
MKIKASPYSNILSVAINLLLAYVVYMLTRIAYVVENWHLFAEGWHALNTVDLLVGSLRFDSSAIFYTNALYIILVLLPLHIKERPWWHTMCKVIFLTINTLAITANLSDAVYSQYTGRRTTWSFFTEFANEGNLGSIFLIEVLHHWYFILLGIALLALMWWLYAKPETPRKMPLATYYITNAVALIAMIPLSICAMRGGASTAVRPITVSNANQYVNTPTETSIVLNTPFSLLRTSGKKPYTNPHYYTEAELDSIYSPLHIPHTEETMNRKNVVVLIIESFGREYTGFYNDTLEGGTYKGYTPFTDSLLHHSLTFTHTFANGRKSIDAMPSVLSSIPMFVESFFLTSASLNDVGGLAQCLDQEGYTTAFFHGAENGSMGFQAFARTTGYQTYYGRTEYNADPRFDGDADFDGTWAIWDEPFLQFYALKMNEMPQPFMTTVFTASSHHPFVIPKQYNNIFAEGSLPMHKCIRYTDNALRHFFATASQQPWFNNTIFVLTADHTNMTQHDLYRTSLGVFSVPIAIFDPSGTLPTGIMPRVAQQIDILPTILSALHYDKPYVAFGKDLLDSTTANWAIINTNGIYQYVLDNWLMLFDGEHITALYDHIADPFERDNLVGTLPDTERTMEQHLKAIIQSYMDRMTTNRLLP